MSKNNFGQVRDLIMGLEADFEKFYDKQNSAAGTRVRKGMQDLKNMAQEIRKEVQDMKNAAAGNGSATADKAKAAPKKAAAPAAKGGKK